MRAAKQTLVVCWIITMISLLCIIVLHAEIDILVQEKVIKTELEYDYNERNFYQGIWSNIFTGAIVSLFTTYVSYNRAKHDLVFQLKANEQIIAMLFNNMTTRLYYDVNLSSPLFKANNYTAIRRFESDIASIKLHYDRMIEAANDYSPFFKTKKSKNLTNGKQLLQELWVEICPVEAQLLVHTEEKDIKEDIDSTRQKVVARKDELKKVSDSIKDY